MTGPLEGTRVLDFTHGVAGPFTTMLLGDLGADVVKVERPGRGDPTRYMNVSDKFDTDIPRSGGDYFLAINRNKRSVGIELKSDEGRALARQLSGWADVVVQNFRPGVMDRLGLGYEALKVEHEGLIYASLTAYGAKGPLAHQPGMDVAVQARSGVMSITGYGEDGRPVKPGVSLADFAGGTHLAVAVLGALLHRSRTGQGQQLSVSLLDATMIMLSNYSVAVMDGGASIKPMGSGHPQLVPFQAFPTMDGFLVVATGTNKLFRELCAVLGLEPLADDPRFDSNPTRVRHRQELVAILSSALAQKCTAEWMSILESKQIPCAPVNGLEQAFADPQMQANDMVVEVDHPVYDTIHVLGVPYKFEMSPCSITQRPPQLGEQTFEVLGSLLHMPEDAIRALAEAGVVEKPLLDAKEM
jgi:crotonobetainyl-CoA:carnitine CoA-transferase CaiB-like acyl-CoA transferase